MKEVAHAEDGARGVLHEGPAANITERLRDLRAELHGNELLNSGTRAGNIYSRMGATVAFAMIEIATLRETQAAMVDAFKRIRGLASAGPNRTYGASDWSDLCDDLDAIFSIAQHGIAKAEGLSPRQPDREAGGTT